MYTMDLEIYPRNRFVSPYFQNNSLNYVVKFFIYLLLSIIYYIIYIFIKKNYQKITADNWFLPIPLSLNLEKINLFLFED